MPEPVALAALNREYAELGEGVHEAVRAVFARGAFILGPEVAALEADLAKYLGVRHVVTCANGTDALVLALRACGIGRGDEVIVPAFTFAATAEAVVLAGATPVFADIGLDTLLIDLEDAARRVTARTRAILPVHLFGRCVEGAALQRFAAGRGIRVVEDAAQAIGADDGRSRAGAIGDVAGFSFYPTKNLGGPGDGGMVTTNDDAVADSVRLLRAHGARVGYKHEVIGTNSRLDEIQATVLRMKLPHLDGWNERRRRAAARYREAGAASGLALPGLPPKGSHIHHHFTLRTADRARFLEHLEARGIGHGVYYAIPVHRQEAFAPWVPPGLVLPNAERAAEEVVSIPVHPWLTGAEIERVAEALAAWSEPGVARAETAARSQCA